MNHLLEKSTLRPFIFLLCYFFFSLAAFLQPAMNYYLVIFDNLNLPVQSTWLAFLNSLTSLVGILACAASVKILGKRRLSLLSMIWSSILSALMGLYIVFQSEVNQPWIFVILFLTLGFTASVAISCTPWIMIGEIFPVKTRSVATGMTGAAFYVVVSIYMKTFYYLQMWLTTQGAFILYSVIGFIGYFYLWMYMPETEGKTMAQIEELFADDARKKCSHFRKKY